MKPRASVIVFVAIWFGLQPLLAAETIYTWVDKNGTKRFSNDPPPNGVASHKQFGSQSQPSASQSIEQEQRKSYNQMMKKIRRDSRRNAQVQRSSEANEKRNAKIERQRKIDAEQKRLMQQLEKAQKMSVRDTSRRRKRRIKMNRIQKQLNELNTSPQTYFNGNGKTK